MRLAPSTEQGLAVYAWRCKTAMKRAIKDGDIDEIARRVTWDTAPLHRKLWLTLRGEAPKRNYVRCKCCGRHTRRTPHGSVLDEYCRHCDRPFPEPGLH
jgi:hypothetical protein